MAILYVFAAIMAAAGVRRFIQVHSPAQTLTLLLAWLFPGLGHLRMGHKKRAAFLGSIVVVLFVAGLFLAGFRNVSPFDRHPIWGLAHLFGGALSGITAGCTHGLTLDESLPYYGVGCLYTASACLLNILLMVDVHDLMQKSPRGEDQ